MCNHTTNIPFVTLKYISHKLFTFSQKNKLKFSSPTRSPLAPLKPRIPIIPREPYIKQNNGHWCIPNANATLTQNPTFLPSVEERKILSTLFLFHFAYFSSRSSWTTVIARHSLNFTESQRKELKPWYNHPIRFLETFNTSTSIVKEAKCTQNFPALERNRANKNHTS